MNAIDCRPMLAVVLVGAGLLLSACGGEPTETDAPTTPVAQAPVLDPTPVKRREPTATATVDPAANPLFPIEVDALPGIPVPIGARTIDVIEATEDTDARVDFALPEGTTIQEMTAWFREQMPEHGWEESEERDGAVVFLHGEQLSARHASQGLERTAMVLFDTLSEEADFSVLAEAAKP